MSACSADVPRRAPRPGEPRRRRHRARPDARERTRDHMGLCRFHAERAASFSVSEVKQFYYCFGCQASGNALTFLVEHQRVTFPETVETLAVRLRLEAPRSGVRHGRESGAGEQQQVGDARRRGGLPRSKSGRGRYRSSRRYMQIRTSRRRCTAMQTGLGPNPTPADPVPDRSRVPPERGVAAVRLPIPSACRAHTCRAHRPASDEASRRAAGTPAQDAGAPRSAAPAGRREGARLSPVGPTVVFQTQERARPARGRSPASPDVRRGGSARRGPERWAAT